MAVEFTKRELYGGAIVAELPNTVFDASDLREIPDHQEVFLLRNTLTNIIFEINEYQSQNAIISNAGSNPSIYAGNEVSGDSNIPAADPAAASYHFKDVIVETDHISDAGIATTAIKLSQATLSQFPAYHSTATVLEPEIDRGVQSTLPVDWQSNPAQKVHQTKVQQLLIRMKEYDTDFCVRINIPLKEFNGIQSDAALTELAIADQIMQKIVESLDVKEFALFRGGE